MSAKIPAEDILHITSLKADWGGRQKCSNQFSFNLVTKKRTYELFAVSEWERDLWVRSFAKMLDVTRIRSESESEFESESDNDELKLREIRMQQDDLTE